jgi:hypothetical protein
MKSYWLYLDMRENTLGAGALGHASLLFPSFPSSGIEQERKGTLEIYLLTLWKEKLTAHCSL